MQPVKASESSNAVASDLYCIFQSVSIVDFQLLEMLSIKKQLESLEMKPFAQNERKYFH